MLHILHPESDTDVPTASNPETGSTARAVTFNRYSKGLSPSTPIFQSSISRSSADRSRCTSCLEENMIELGGEQDSCSTRRDFQCEQTRRTMMSIAEGWRCFNCRCHVTCQTQRCLVAVPEPHRNELLLLLTSTCLIGLFMYHCWV